MNTIKICDFSREQVSEAQALALAGYEEERRQVPALPPAVKMPELLPFADNGLGVAAYENGKMTGFLCAADPFDHAFGSTDVKGVFSPMGANAAVPGNREKIYGAMYQAAAEKWVSAGAVSHGICLYAHDVPAQRQFFRYGFGMRCVDSIRRMEDTSCAPCEGYTFRELAPDEYVLAYPFERMLKEHFCVSPVFMNRKLESMEEFCARCEKEHDRCFAAFYHGTMCAYMKLSESGETFITEAANYRHVNGAFCLEEHRGKGLYQNLLNYVIGAAKQEGFEYLGVDFESINPAAHGFWKKNFSAYTHGVVRRIDERILEWVKEKRQQNL